LTGARPRRRWLRWAGAGALLLVAATAGGTALVLRMRGVLAGRSDDLVAAVGRAVGLPITAGNVALSWWPPGVTAQNLEIPDESPYGPGDLARADEARIEVAVLPLLRGKIVVTEVRLAQPVVFVVRGFDGGWNIGTTPARPVAAHEGEGGGLAPAPSVVIDSIRVRGARLVYRDRAIPGLGEFEVKGGNVLLRRLDDSYRIDFNAQTLGGPEENLEGSMVVPRGADDAAQAVLQVHARDIAGGRLPDVIVLLRGEMPFGIALDGKVAARVDVHLPARWPPSRAAGSFALDARAAALHAAAGWVVKPAGTPLDVDLDVRAGPEGLAVDRARLASGDLRLDATPVAGEAPAPDAGQQPLRLALEGIDATRIAAWMPALGFLHPRGPLAVEGTLTPSPDGVATDLRIATSDLALQRSRGTINVGSASLDLSLAHGRNGVLGALRIAGVKSPDGTIASVAASVGGTLQQPLDVRIDGARLVRNGVAVDTVSLDLLVDDGSTQIRKLEVAGLGGTLAARGRVLRDRDGVYTIAVQPEWSGVDLGRLTSLLGDDGAGTGLLAGRASLETSGNGLDAVLANLNGTFEASLGAGTLPGLNVARVTLASLDGIPRLQEAIDRRAREHVPELLAATTSFDSLRVSGTVNQGRVELGELRLDARDYSIDAHGHLAFDGATDLEGNLVLTKDASRSLLSGTGGVLETLAGDDDQVRIPISVAGVYPDLKSRPSKDFLADAAARAVRLPGHDRAASFLRRLLGGDD
jgi:hypothetical protein